jgi:hypothetical protein
MSDINERVASLETQMTMMLGILKEVRDDVRAIPASLPCNKTQERITVLETNQKWHRVGLFGGVAGLASIAWHSIKSVMV